MNGRLVDPGQPHGLPDTKITAVTGYRKPVDWLESAAFETLMLERLTRGSRTDGFFNGLARDYGTLSKRLGLVAATAKMVYTART